MIRSTSFGMAPEGYRHGKLAMPYSKGRFHAGKSTSAE